MVIGEAFTEDKAKIIPVIDRSCVETGLLLWILLRLLLHGGRRNCVKSVVDSREVHYGTIISSQKYERRAVVVAFLAAIAHEMLQYDDAALTPRPNDILGLTRMNYWEQIRASKHLIRQYEVWIEEVAFF